MRLRWRGDPGAVRRSFSFSASGIAHGALLGLLVFGNAGREPEPARSLYDEMIRPQERRLVWYHLQDRLPDVRPPAGKAEAKPLRAARRFEQRIVAGPKDDARPPQMVWSPAPETAAPKIAPLPNVLAVEMKRPSRPFQAPETRRRTIEAPALPDAPDVAMQAAPAGPNLRELRKAFTPPPESKGKAAVKLPDAAPAPGSLGAAPAGPNLRELHKAFTPPAESKGMAAVKLPDAAPAPGSLGAAPAGPNLRELHKAFTPPPESKGMAAVKLPDAAPAPGSLGAAPAGPNLRELHKAFTPPAESKGMAAVKLPDAAPAPGSLGAAPAGPNLAPPRKTFTPPRGAAGSRPAASATAEMPTISGGLPSNDTAHLAIIGLNPAHAPELPERPESRRAGFSAGPRLQPDGAETDGNASGVAVPGVTVWDGTSRAALLAAIRPMAHVIPTGPPPEPAPTRIMAAPDPALEGRVVYTMAIQMPNVTSWSGSWLVWYAAREQAAGAMKAPSPLRKVDPKYIASAMAERVEGVVRLAATIHKTGRVDSVKLLRHLDDRLDRSAMEALAKWEFEPARRDGVPVDVDAVFEIPFRLAPKTPK